MPNLDFPPQNRSRNYHKDHCNIWFAINIYVLVIVAFTSFFFYIVVTFTQFTLPAKLRLRGWQSQISVFSLRFCSTFRTNIWTKMSFIFVSKCITRSKVALETFCWHLLVHTAAPKKRGIKLTLQGRNLKKFTNLLTCWILTVQT